MNCAAIDITYTWCDDADEKWRAKRLATAVKFGVSLKGHANGDCRYRANDDLRYALRSLELCVPWIRKVHLVVDDDISLPDWLDTAHRKLNVVRLSEIIPPEFLPCFCSGTIEQWLADIPGLAPRFLMANDDCLFGHSIAPEFFFAQDGFPFVRLGGPREMNDTGGKYADYHTRMNNSLNLLKTEFGEFESLAELYRRYPHHNIDAYLRNDMIACRRHYSDALMPTMKYPFRRADQFQRILYSGYALAIGHAHSRLARNHATVHRPWYKRLLVHGWAESLQFVGKDWCYAERQLNRYNPALFCCNDTAETTAEDRETLREFYEKRFPAKSSFEK